MKIFVTGATGFIGEEVACGLRRNGHDVQALDRNVHNNTAVRRLVEQEVQIIEGDLIKPETYKHVCRDCDIIIHCAVDYTKYEQIDNIAVDTILSVCEQQNRILTEEDLTLTAGWVVQERHLNEQKVLHSSFVYGCVIRPAWVYGKRSKHFIQYFLQTLNKPSTIIVSHPNKSYSEVHIDDLVQFYVLACECQSPETLIQSQIYNVGDTSHYTNMEIARAFTTSMNWNGQLVSEDEYEEGKDEAWKFRNRTVIVDSTKAEKWLGFKCKHKLMLDDIEILKNSCLAKHKIQQ